ncbi:DUF342 domain-containing protein [[Clostridium] polysaccharolyticum]|uniref:Flagellar Assembly Protein A N-terminal region domain-containing protein n=1 Tax=[Clostridium] polysaccharolyticum TaxID=29364 RepID=A0A1H9Y377_9FIRM|nr:FapA family protein [[Clostridium] polysaccharolyticum]SES63249.1 hypothetical protein SAMN04487772_101107 [[Clostridium] polysaccharolyticum]
MNSINGYFQVVPKEDGTYLKMFPPVNGGEQIQTDELKKYLDNCGVKEYDLHEVMNYLCSNEVHEVKISAKVCWAILERMELLYDKSRRVGVVRFYPPSANGKNLNKKEILDELKQKGVVHGIVEESIDQYLRHRVYCTNIVVARATLPVEGKDAKIEYFFNTEITSKPKLNEDGSVDFHRLDNMSKVKEGELLARLTVADRGTPGTDIMGGTISPKRVKAKILKKTQYTILSDDGLELFSAVSGHVTLVDDKVFVSDVYEVPADVDASTGDIDYDGNVLVRGNVRTGYIVRAKGNIVVNGVVEGATLVADGEIVLKRGIQGMNRGILQANGNIVTKFIENSTVKSGGTISTEAILHSSIEAKNEIIVGGKRGLVTGGELKAGSKISLKVAGSTMGTATVLEVGIDPAISERYREVEKRIDDLKREQTQLEQAFQLLKKKVMQGAKLPADKIMFIKSIPSKIKADETEMEYLLDEYLALKEVLDEMNKGTIEVQNMIYPGVKLLISNLAYFIRTEEHHCRYLKVDGEVKSVYL